MIDITHKRPSLRRATAQAKLYCSAPTLERIAHRDVPKGDVLETSRAAALLAVKRTPELLPFCHPIAIEHTEVLFVSEADGVRVDVTVAAIARTGVEVEAMTAASVAALNLYDMLKPIDDNLRIGDIHLVRKSGGKSDFRDDFVRPLRAGVLVTSDSVAAGRKTDRAGAAVCDRLESEGLSVAAFEIVADDAETIANRVTAWVDDLGLDLVVTVGGTGLGPRDLTVEAVRPLLEREVPGIAEAIRAHGIERTPYAALSRGIAGQRGRSLIVTLPGSSSGARESLDALLPWALHVIHVFDRLYHHDA